MILDADDDAVVTRRAKRPRDDAGVFFGASDAFASAALDPVLTRLRASACRVEDGPMRSASIALLDETSDDADGANDALVRAIATLVDRGVVSTVCSLADRGAADARLNALGLRDLVVFCDFGDGLKGDRVRATLEAMHLSSRHALFVDDGPANRADVLRRNPGIGALSPAAAEAVLATAARWGKADAARARLAQYKVLERKAEARRDRGGDDDAAFLTSCRIRARVVAVAHDDVDGDRITELLQRANRLNFTKRRRGELLAPWLERRGYEVACEPKTYAAVRFSSLRWLAATDDGAVAALSAALAEEAAARRLDGDDGDGGGGDTAGLRRLRGYDVVVQDLERWLGRRCRETTLVLLTTPDAWDPLYASSHWAAVLDKIPVDVRAGLSARLRDVADALREAFADAPGVVLVDRTAHLGPGAVQEHTHVNREAQVATALAVIGGLEGGDALTGALEGEEDPS
ncbi:hypothetical protein JL722_2282 [Aureococcus anophagefferens]|nr:hypothetical protein JL722_2282 [Aureococcus anophagefferens]